MARIDRRNWRIWEIYFGAIFLFPVRFSILVISVFFLSIAAFFLKYDPKLPNKEYPAWKTRVMSIGSQITCRIILYAGGFYWIPKKKLKIKDFEPDYPAEKYATRDHKNVPIVVSNHVNWTDIMVSIACGGHGVSFLSKAGVAKYPLFGSVAIALQCIFLERESDSQRQIVLEQVLERGRLLKEGKQLPPICIFPEGTTSAGNHLLTFKRGAFEPLLPIKTYLIKYLPRYYTPSMDIIPTYIGVIFFFSQLINQVEFFEFDPYYPDHLPFNNNEKDWEIYAAKIRNLMLSALKIKDSNSGYRDLIAYEEFAKKYN